MNQKLLRLGMQFFADPGDVDPPVDDPPAVDPPANDKPVLTEEQKNDLLNKGKEQVLKDLGITPGDKDAFEKIKKMLMNQNDKDDKDDKDEPQLDKNVENEIDEANKRATMAEAKLEAISMGVNVQFVDDVVTLAISKVSEDKDLKTIIGEFKVKYPMFFLDDQGIHKDTGSNLNTIIKNGEKQSLGQRLAAKRVKQKGKSFWD